MLQGAALQSGINPSLGNGAGGTRRVIRGQDGPVIFDHQRCSIHQESAHAGARAAMALSTMSTTSATNPA